MLWLCYFRKDVLATKHPQNISMQSYHRENVYMLSECFLFTGVPWSERKNSEDPTVKSERHMTTTQGEVWVCLSDIGYQRYS